MAKIQISPQAFIAEANRLLQAEPGVEEGLAFLPFPEGAVELAATGYQYEGAWHPAYQRAWDKANQKYEIKL